MREGSLVTRLIEHPQIQFVFCKILLIDSRGFSGFCRGELYRSWALDGNATF